MSKKNKGKRSDEENTTEKREFPSAKLLLSISMDEYTKERERANSFDNRAGLFMSGLIALMTVYLQVIPFKGIYSIYARNDKTSIILSTILICILFLSVVSLICALFFFIKTLDSKAYKRVNFENLVNEDNNRLVEDVMEYAMVNHYHEILIFNVDINTNKSKAYSKGIILSVIFFILILISTIGLLIVV